jgi:hypothetical protein
LPACCLLLAACCLLPSSLRPFALSRLRTFVPLYLYSDLQIELLRSSDKVSVILYPQLRFACKGLYIFSPIRDIFKCRPTHIPSLTGR